MFFILQKINIFKTIQTTPREQAIENVVNVLDIFEQKGIMSPGEYGNLKEVVRNLNVEILELIREAEDGIRRIREGDGAQNTESRENASCKISKLGDPYMRLIF